MRMQSYPMGLVAVCLSAACAARAAAQIRVHPTGVDVNGQGATTVFLTFGPLTGYRAAESFWCGEVVPASPDVGRRCDPSTLFGALPARHDLARLSGSAFTDIMSIPPSVTRRAYQAAAAGALAPFFYVRRFISNTGGPDQYVAVTCRLSGGGARVPLSLTDVTLAFEVETPVLHLAVGQAPPAFAARIVYTGTGRLVGRWEIVLPGDEQPQPRDLLTEATLPLEERGTQRRYTELERFNVFLPPGGRFTLRGPDVSRLPVVLEGAYSILLRVEASDDKEGDSDRSAAGAGTGTVHSGAVAGFALPALRYVVGSGGSEHSPARPSPSFGLLLPAADADITTGQTLQFAWHEHARAVLYRLEIETADHALILTAIAQRGRPVYQNPPWLAERAAGRTLRWRVVALDARGNALAHSEWRALAPQREPTRNEIGRTFASPVSVSDAQSAGESPARSEASLARRNASPALSPVRSP
ncbi:MAG: hypothetical protein ACRENP_15205 [Longimicrobiales bacterium]